MLKRVLEEALVKARSTYERLAELGSASEKRGEGAFGDVSMLADLLCEEVLIKELSSRLGNPAFISEERGTIGDPEKSDYVVLIDPLDGSTNMSRGIRFFSAGIAIANGPTYSDVIAAGIIDMDSGTLYISYDGEVTVGGGRPRLSNVTSLEEAVISLDPRAAKRGGEFRTRYIKLVERLRHYRCFGSALLEMAHIVSSSLDGFVCLSHELRVMDVIPAAHILEEAGCEVASEPVTLGEVRLASRERLGIIACSNEELFRQLKGITCFGDR